MRRFLLIPQLKIHNANAMSSPYTIGFPAMTAWLGAVHALQRRLQTKGFKDVSLERVAVSCHEFDLQTHRSPNDFVSSIIGTSNPLDKDGGRPSFVEEARCHLKVSLLIEYQGVDPDEESDWLELVKELVTTMKFASGDVITSRHPEILRLSEDSGERLKKLTDRLMLGYVIKERRDLMVEEMKKGNDALTALLNNIKVMHRPELSFEGVEGSGEFSAAGDDSQNPEKPVVWKSRRKQTGWIVPIAVGFQGISELGRAANQRDAETPHRFAECVVTLGEFVMPYRIKNIDEVLWHYQSEIANDLYVCQNQRLSLSN
jgi:CRISPR-associated protein Csy2